MMGTYNMLVPSFQEMLDFIPTSEQMAGEHSWYFLGEILL
jgi:hypothetical protein